MLRILGSPKRLCDGITRRDLLRVGGLGAVGLGLDQLLGLKSTQATAATTDLSASFGRAKRCILLYLYGAPSQIETVDMKPLAPVEIRGSLKPVPSVLPGLDVCELMPRMAKMMDRVTVVRSVTHPYPLHGVAFATTGVPAIDVAMELNPTDPRHEPYFGSIVEYFDRQRPGVREEGTVQNVALPFSFSSQRVDQPLRAGPYAAYLGSQYHPVWTEFLGKGTRSTLKQRPGFAWEGMEPYLGCTDDSYFRVSATGPQPELTADRLDRRKSLLAQFDESRRHLDNTDSGRSLNKFQQMAFSLVNSPQVAEALDIRREKPEVRELYGMHLFGQSCLAARRMLEAGTRLVSVFWDEYGLAGDAWDTHWDHFPRMEKELLPGLDTAFSGLVLDLEQRGMLDDTLVVCLSEHGRTPRIYDVRGGGRDHWSRAYSVMFAGGGTARGKVVGGTDKHAGDVIERPVSPKDLLATMYHLLGIDPHGFVPDRTGRPMPLLPGSADVVGEMLA